MEDKLVEETNYKLEISQSKEIAKACVHIPNLLFPEYYDTYSSDRIITMDFMKGEHLSEFAKYNSDKEKANQLGQALVGFLYVSNSYA